jgi:predicted component of type VI protein secretion system
MEVRFVFNSSSGKPRIHSKRLPVLIGRSDAGEIKLRIPKDSVSRRHCEFVLDDAGRVCVRDLESTNGTFLDGRQIAPRVAAPVSSGCTVKLGNVGFRVEYQVGPAVPSVHDSDTIPIEAATGPVDVEELEPTPPEPPGGVPATEPLVSPMDAEPQPAAGDFGFLAAAEPDAAPSDGAWPTAEDASPGGDADLNDFLKGLP